jgi:hypothetical protein
LSDSSSLFHGKITRLLFELQVDLFSELKNAHIKLKNNPQKIVSLSMDQQKIEQRPHKIITADMYRKKEKSISQ